MYPLYSRYIVIPKVYPLSQHWTMIKSTFEATPRRKTGGIGSRLVETRYRDTEVMVS